MRYVDIYHDNTPIVTDCAQLGHPELNRTPNVKRFTMADGAPCMYAAAKDTAAFTLQLECNAENAKKIANSARFGCLTFAGMSYGTNSQSLPEQSGVIGYITGAVQIQEISANADIYTVKIPLQLQVDASGEIEPVSVPAIKVFSLVIGGHGESLTDANYRYYPGGTFIRKRTISCGDSAISVSCSSGVPDGGELYTTIARDGSGTILTGGDSLSGALPLEKGNNTFTLTVRKKEGANYKAQTIRFSVYRKVIWEQIKAIETGAVYDAAIYIDFRSMGLKFHDISVEADILIRSSATNYNAPFAFLKDANSQWLLKPYIKVVPRLYNDAYGWISFITCRDSVPNTYTGRGSPVTTDAGYTIRFDYHSLSFTPEGAAAPSIEVAVDDVNNEEISVLAIGNSQNLVTPGYRMDKYVFYSVKLYNKGELINDLVPVVNIDPDDHRYGWAALYDLLNDKVYVPSGAASFIPIREED